MSISYREDGGNIFRFLWLALGEKDSNFWAVGCYFFFKTWKKRNIVSGLTWGEERGAVGSERNYGLRLHFSLLYPVVQSTQPAEEADLGS